VSALRTAASRAIKEAAALGDRVRAPDRGVVVLLYHRVGGRTASEIDLPATLFDEQMAWLADRGAAVSLDDALATLDALDPLNDDASDGPDRDPVAVTFDDGTADLVDVALPILVRHRIPALIYVSTDFVENGRPFPGEGTPMSWAAAREALATGLVSIGSHTHTHALLDRVDEAAAADELDRSIDLIADRLGVEAAHFAYPKAVLGTPAAQRLVRDRFRSAALGGNRANPYRVTDPYRLARSAIQRSDGMRFFERKAEGGMAFEDRARRALNRVRYAGRSD
jgi:peptidoglycan/xylan/chitin deacetylase (PgdA/CDA1 family)